MFVNAFRMELVKVFRRPMTWILAGILALLVAGLYVTLYAALQASLSDPAASPGTSEALQTMLAWPQAFSGPLGLVCGTGLGGLMLVILAGAVMAQEFSWRTAHLWLSRGLPRSAFLLGKYAALVVAGMLLVLTALLVATPLTAWFTYRLTGSLNLAGFSVAGLALSFARTVLSLLPFASLTFLVAVLTHSTAAAISLGLVYTLLLEDIVVQLLGMAGGVWAGIARILPGSLAAALLESNERLVSVDLGSGVDAALSGPWLAAGGLALYAAAFLGLSLWAFRRQNLTG